jgi:hypothetical protein
MTTADPTLAARLIELYDAVDTTTGGVEYAMALHDALLSGQLITLADAEAMVRAAENRGLLNAVEIINANVSPCVPPTTWTDEELEGYSNGQMDAAASFMYAIRARVHMQINE